MTFKCYEYPLLIRHSFHGKIQPLNKELTKLSEMFMVDKLNLYSIVFMAVCFFLFFFFCQTTEHNFASSAGGVYRITMRSAHMFPDKRICVARMTLVRLIFILVFMYAALFFAQMVFFFFSCDKIRAYRKLG